MHAFVFYRDNCRYCDAAKALLDARGIPYILRHVMDDLDARRDFRGLTDPPPKTVPQIVLDGNLIGGYTELKAHLG